MTGHDAPQDQDVVSVLWTPGDKVSDMGDGVRTMAEDDVRPLMLWDGG